MLRAGLLVLRAGLLVLPADLPVPLVGLPVPLVGLPVLPVLLARPLPDRQALLQGLLGQLLSDRRLPPHQARPPVDLLALLVGLPVPLADLPLPLARPLPEDLLHRRAL